MTTRLQLARQDARRRLHQEMGVPALYIFASEDPVEVMVRIHDKSATIGDVPGLETIVMRDVELKLRFWRAELPLPKRGAKVSVAEGEAYLLGEAGEPHGDTIDVSAVRLTDAEAAGLPVP
jgi:hypothetical protein